MSSRRENLPKRQGLSSFLIALSYRVDPMNAVLRLMTANLLHDRCDIDHFADVVDELEPDIVVAQELGPRCAEVLTDTFPNHRLHPTQGFLGRGIATRFDAEFGVIEMPGRSSPSATIHLGETSVRLAGIHLLNPVNYPWWVTARTRSGQLESLFRWLDEGGGGVPVIVAGDFNASPMWPAYRQMADRLDDLVAEWAARTGTRPERTWGWRPGWPRMLRIDHIFGRGMAAEDVQVVPIRGTDHAAVVADLTLSRT